MHRRSNASWRSRRQYSANVLSRHSRGAASGRLGHPSIERSQYSSDRTCSPKGKSNSVPCSFRIIVAPGGVESQYQIARCAGLERNSAGEANEVPFPILAVLSPVAKSCLTGRNASGAVPRGDPRAGFVGGQGGIRTHDTVTRTPHFECGAINHSTTCPKGAEHSLAVWRPQEHRRKSPGPVRTFDR
jgi:hypothetical protein